eukprot:10471355-Alexandrium_andersonii.AAC.1
MGHRTSQVYLGGHQGPASEPAPQPYLGAPSGSALPRWGHSEGFRGRWGVGPGWAGLGNVVAVPSWRIHRES